MNTQIYDVIEYFKNKNFQIEYDEFKGHGYHNIYYRIWNKYIMIHVESYDGGNIYRMGIDPKWCFNKLSRCSIIAWFPMKKREYKLFFRYLDRITNIKDPFFKKWYKEASTSWCGATAEFGYDNVCNL